MSKGRKPPQKIRVFWPPTRRIEYISDDPSVSSDEEDTYEFGVSSWFEAHIKSFDEATGKHKVIYNDRTSEHIDLLKLDSNMAAWELAPYKHCECGKWFNDRL